MKPSASLLVPGELCLPCRRKGCRDDVRHAMCRTSVSWWTLSLRKLELPQQVRNRQLRARRGRRVDAAFGYLLRETGCDGFELRRGKLDRCFELLTGRLLRFLLHLSFSCGETKGPSASTAAGCYGPTGWFTVISVT